MILKIPLPKLKEIIIESKGCDPLRLESFLTYSINYLDEDYLKKKVVVTILGEREELNPNHYNLLHSYFKKIDIITEDRKIYRYTIMTILTPWEII